MDKAKIIKFHRGEVTEYFIKTKEDFVPLTDRIIAKYIPRYPDFSDKAKKREWRKWIKSGAEIVREAEVDSCLPNSRRKMRLGNGQKRRPTREDLAKGAGFLLEGTHLWTDLVSGYYILSTIVAGCHARALRQQFPSLCLMLSLRSDSTETEKILRHIVHAAVPRKKWKGDGCVVRRSPILKYPAFDNDPLTPTKLLSFSQITIRGVKKFPIPCAYEDTAALLIGAKSHQVREAEPYIQNAAAILLNCGRGDQSPLRLTSKNLEGYDPELLDQIAQNAPYIAAVLRWWWARYADKEESAWAQEMASRAKKVFPLADKRFVRLEVDPKELRPQLLYQVLGDFIDQLEQHGLLPAEQADLYRKEATGVFSPAPSVPDSVVLPRQANEPEVFLDAMRKLVAEHSNSIVPDGARCVKSQKFFGAWRTISDVRYLVMEEGTWAKQFAKAIKLLDGVAPCDLTKGPQRSRFLRPLGEQGITKMRGDDPRYRYDLFEAGKRDKTYVVAIPADLLQIPTT